MGLFGTTAPKIVSGATTVNFDHATILKNEPEYERSVHENSVSLDRNIICYGAYWTFEIRDNLFQYGSPATKYAAIKALLHTDVTLWAHRDGEAFRNAIGAPVPFAFNRLHEITLRDTDFIVALRLQFLSLGYVEMFETTTTERYLITEKTEIPITTEDGKKIILG